jgi:phage gp45-like
MSLDHVWRRMQNLVAWGQTTTTVQDGGATPTVQVQLSALETKDGLQVLGQFGFSSSTPKGSRVVVIFGAGDRSKGTILGTVNPRTRRTGLAEGETVIFDNWGNEVHLSQAGVTV